MKTIKSKGGPFQERPYYERIDIERICTDALKTVDLLPADPSPVRIERFIEKRFKVVSSYEDLPTGVLGFSRFGKKGLEAVVISRALAEDPSRSAERRIITTLAHEAGHALLHGHLFALDELQPGLFGEAVTGPKILCRDDADPAAASRPTRYNGRWWEFQANQAIGPLLLPAPLVAKALEGMLETYGTFDSVRISESRRASTAARLAEIFEVNPVVARIRLDELFPAQDTQLTL